MDNDELDSLRQWLDREAARINSVSFIADDPVQFPRRFTALPDIEITALLSATIAWGRRTMICRDCEKMLTLMGGEPWQFVHEQAYDLLPDINIHRTFFAADMRYMLRGLHRIYARYDSLCQYAAEHGVGKAEAPAWELARLLSLEMAAANDGRPNSRCLPTNLRATALKRLNMALRWLVRDDGIVDLGVWDCIRPSQLYIPLDVHVGDTARALGMTTRRSNDRTTVEQIMTLLRQFRPDDPVLYDYALFGIGIQSLQGSRRL